MGPGGRENPPVGFENAPIVARDLPSSSGVAVLDVIWTRYLVLSKLIVVKGYRITMPKEN